MLRNAGDRLGDSEMSDGCLVVISSKDFWAAVLGHAFLPFPFRRDFLEVEGVQDMALEFSVPYIVVRIFPRCFLDSAQEAAVLLAL